MFLIAGTGEFAVAQDIVGRISGTVTDAQGAAVPGATVTIINEATGIPRSLTTDGSGYFVADDLPVGKYTVTVEAKGFKKTLVAGNPVTAGGRLTVNVTMQVGALTETVTVTAVVNMPNTTSGEISATITNQEMVSLPMNQRHYESVVGLIPGAALQSSGLNAANITSGYNNSIADINGQRLDGQNWSVDGGWNLDSGSNNSVFNEVGVDFIREVDVQTSNYDAEFGRSNSATVNVITKSGGEQYHGGGFEFVQNNDWNAETAGHQTNESDCNGLCGCAPVSPQRLRMVCRRPHPLYPAEGQAVLLCRSGVEEISRVSRRIRERVGIVDVPDGGRSDRGFLGRLLGSTAVLD